MTLRKWILSVIAIAIAIGCILLGAWQIRRLWARQKANAIVAARRSAPEVELDSLPRDTADAQREALQALGPIFVKFGQMLSTRRDLLPADLAEADPPFAGCGWMDST